jgi:hypothetical protein
MLRDRCPRSDEVDFGRGTISALAPLAPFRSVMAGGGDGLGIFANVVREKFHHTQREGAYVFTVNHFHAFRVFELAAIAHQPR